MFKIKYKKHLTVLFTVLLLLIFNFNTFAVAPYSFTVKPFEKGKFLIYRSYHYGNTNGDTEDITDNYTDYLTIGFDDEQSYIYPAKSNINEHYYYSIISLMPLNFIDGEQYNFSFDCKFSYNAGGNDTWSNKLYVCLIVVDMSTNEWVNTIDVYDSKSTGIGYSQSVSGSFIFDAGTSNSYGVALLTQPSLGVSNSAVVHNRFTMTHPKFEMTNPLYGEHFDPPPNPLDDLNKDFEDIVNNLPDMDDVDLDELMKPFDFSEYNDGFKSFNKVFTEILNATNMTSILLFTLTFGLGIYILGRRLRG